MRSTQALITDLNKPPFWHLLVPQQTAAMLKISCATRTPVQERHTKSLWKQVDFTPLEVLAYRPLLQRSTHLSTSRIFILLAVTFLITATLFAAPAPKPKKPPEATGMVEIDFSTLPASGVKYELQVQVSTAQENFSKPFPANEDDTPDSTRQFVYVSLKAAGHEVEYVGDSKIRIKSRDNLPIIKCSVTSNTLPKGTVPVVRPVEK
jgi:hypothetical protein